MWPMTGGCHYAMSCENYKTGCGHCKQLHSKNSFDLSKIVVYLKTKSYPKSMKCVGISSWMSQTASESYLFKDCDIRTIHNNINTGDFFPVNKETAKRILGIATGKKIVLAGAQNIGAFYKGFDHFLTAVKTLDRGQYHLVFFGKADDYQLKNIRCDFSNFGFLQDLISLRLIYSAADVFVAPSLMEAFGKTIAEAMACGTPVVAFDANGPKDIIDHEKNGYLAKPIEPEDLKKGIEWIANHPQPEMLATKAREKIVQSFDVKTISQKYKELYEEILSETDGKNDRRQK
jgi:glycosyltransferase involved in cell wall biosynthesis